ncbi:hypothetical protein [Streptomyces nigrescens]|uniref:hypothetical protein n=1 Tax=Streptomyces nigrescens TaxID=1920 RepID=UPI0034783253
MREHVVVLAEQITPRYRLLIWFGAFQGLRSMEAAGGAVRTRSPLQASNWSRSSGNGEGGYAVPGIRPGQGTRSDTRDLGAQGATFRDLRHFADAVPVASGLELRKVQARMRHARLTGTLDTYGYLARVAVVSSHPA